MNGKTWRIAIEVGMLEYGESGVTGAQISTIANGMFPDVPFPASFVEAEWELNQFRKHLAFLREPGTGPGPSLIQLLRWSLTGSGLKPDHPIVVQFRRYLNSRNLRNPELQRMAHVGEPPVEESRPASFKKWRIRSDGGQPADLVAAGGNHSSESHAGFK